MRSLRASTNDFRDLAGTASPGPGPAPYLFVSSIERLISWPPASWPSILAISQEGRPGEAHSPQALLPLYRSWCA
jgi:hypothetical protein